MDILQKALKELQCLNIVEKDTIITNENGDYMELSNKTTWLVIDEDNEIDTMYDFIESYTYLLNHPCISECIANELGYLRCYMQEIFQEYTIEELEEIFIENNNMTFKEVVKILKRKGLSIYLIKHGISEFRSDDYIAWQLK